MNNNTHGPKNWAHLHADSLRRIVARHDPEIDNAEMERRAAIYELLGDALNIDRDALHTILNTGGLNDEMLAYASLAARRCGFDPETVQQIRNKMRFYFDELTAAEALKEWAKVEGTTFTPPKD